MLGRATPTWPDTGANALIKRVRREIGASGPAHSAELSVNTRIDETGHCSSTLEHRTTHATEHLNLALEAVCKRDPQSAVVRNFNVRDIWSQTDHFSGSIA